MRKFFLVTTLVVAVLIINTSKTFAQTTDSTNTNPDWVVRPKAGQLLTKPEKVKPEWKKHMRYGGNFWLSYWNGAYIELSPMVGYKLNEKGTTAGVGVNMIYSSNRYSNYSSFDYGFRLFLQHPLTRYLAIHGEIEAMNAQSSNFIDYYSNNIADPTIHKWEAYPQVGLVVYPNKFRGDFDGPSYYIALLYNLSYPNVGYNGSGYLNGGITLRVGFF